jgi:signal transduction histidine kinase
LERSKDLRDIINRLLYLSEVENLRTIECEEIHTKDFVTDIANTLMSVYPGKKIQLVLPNEDLVIAANRQMLGSVITNLAENALKYSSTSAQISWSKDARGILLNIEDDGPGIPEESRKLVFEPFVKLRGDADEPPIKSHGLGLSIVRACLSALKGNIELTKSSLGGLRVTVLLPKSV